jgi:hypothetical protein
VGIIQAVNASFIRVFRQHYFSRIEHKIPAEWGPRFLFRVHYTGLRGIICGAAVSCCVTHEIGDLDLGGSPCRVALQPLRHPSSILLTAKPGEQDFISVVQARMGEQNSKSQIEFHGLMTTLVPSRHYLYPGLVVGRKH